jgi:hypothetical protein
MALLFVRSTSGKHSKKEIKEHSVENPLVKIHLCPRASVFADYLISKSLFLPKSVGMVFLYFGNFLICVLSEDQSPGDKDKCFAIERSLLLRA